LLTGFGAIYIITNTPFWLVSVWLAILVVVLVIELIRFAERNHRDLANFLMAIRQEDFSSSVSSKAKTKSKFKLAYDEILGVFQNLRQQKEFNHHYLQNIVERVNTALICLDSTDEIKLMNDAAKTLFRKPYLKNLGALERIDPQLAAAAGGVEPNAKKLVKLFREGGVVPLSVQVSEFSLLSENYRLVAFQDIGAELTAQEIASWQKLIRVLNHEIMNSAIPISNLSEVALELVQNAGPNSRQNLTGDQSEDLRNSLMVIKNRSRGLVKFVNSYKSLTNIGPPNFKETALRDLVDRVLQLLGTRLKTAGVEVEVVVHSDCSVLLDPDLFEQVLINLVLNAAEATQNRDRPSLKISIKQDSQGKALIQFQDNGQGIEEQDLENIFVPFFTTKKKGSGVGLSLVRQIMWMHKGTVSVKSEPGVGSIFRLSF